MKISDTKIRIRELIDLADQVIGSAQESNFGGSLVDSELLQELRSSSLSFLKTTFGMSHPYYIDFDTKVNDIEVYRAEQAKGILNAVNREIEGGWIFTVKGLVSAEIFSNFLEMAEHLLEEGFKDAAAVMIGSVLEEHLRQLCISNSIETEIHQKGKTVFKKADRLNAELSSTDVYNKLDNKSVTSWLDLRNNAAHGRYSEYSKDQVELMYQGVSNFMIRISS